MKDDLDQLDAAGLRLLALPLMGFKRTGLEHDIWVRDGIHFYSRDPDLPDPATSIADAMALAEAMRPHAWFQLCDSPDGHWRATFNGRTHADPWKWFGAATALTPARAITLAAIRAARASEQNTKGATKP